MTHPSGTPSSPSAPSAPSADTLYDPPHPETTQLARFHRWLATKRSDLPDVDPNLTARANYASLHRFSVQSPEHFWPLLAEFLGFADLSPRQIPPDSAFVPAPLGTPFIHAQFFTHTRINAAALTLAAGAPDSPAIVARSEDPNHRSRITFQELIHQVGSLASTLQQRGITAGDRVAGLIGNIPQAVIGHLACQAIGAVWTSCSLEFGTESILSRFEQTSPRILITLDHYHYKGKRVCLTSRVDAILSRLPSVETVIHAGPDTLTVDRPCLNWTQALSPDPLPPETWPLFPFSHPSTIVYTSGTTGPPKCLIHSAGGTLLNLTKEHKLHCNVQPGDRVFYYTTTSWMMWNWLIGGLAAGATLVLYDGHPTWPDLPALWRLASQERVTLFGTSAGYIDLCRRQGFVASDHADLSSLRTITSTGSPLLDENFDYVYRQIKPDVHLASISGGTDILGCFMMGAPTLPLRRGELQVAALGNDVCVLDEQNRPIRNRKGQLAVRSPFVNMPVGLWNDPHFRRYTESYFALEDGTIGPYWRHGDFTLHTDDGAFVIFGRSDATLNPGGVRIGTAEIYRALSGISAISKSAVVGIQRKGSEKIVLLVVLSEDHQGATHQGRLTPDLAQIMRQRIRDLCSPRHVPSVILAVSDLPHTHSGKLSERVIRDCLEGVPTTPTSALANPECLREIQQLIPLTLSA